MSWNIQKSLYIIYINIDVMSWSQQAILSCCALQVHVECWFYFLLLRSFCFFVFLFDSFFYFYIPSSCMFGWAYQFNDPFHKVSMLHSQNYPTHHTHTLPPRFYCRVRLCACATSGSTCINVFIGLTSCSS